MDADTTATVKTAYNRKLKQGLKKGRRAPPNFIFFVRCPLSALSVDGQKQKLKYLILLYYLFDSELKENTSEIHDIPLRRNETNEEITRVVLRRRDRV